MALAFALFPAWAGDAGAVRVFCCKTLLFELQVFYLITFRLSRIISTIFAAKSAFFCTSSDSPADKRGFLPDGRRESGADFSALLEPVFTAPHAVLKAILPPYFVAFPEKTASIPAEKRLVWPKPDGGSCANPIVPAHQPKKVVQTGRTYDKMNEQKGTCPARPWKAGSPVPLRSGGAAPAPPSPLPERRL